MKFIKGDLVDLPLGYGYAVFMRYDEYFNRAFFYNLSKNEQDWDFAEFFDRNANKVG